MPECPTREALQAYAQTRCAAEGVPWEITQRQYQQESGWRHCRDDGSLVTSPSNAVGVCQIIARWHPDVDPADPWASLTYAIRWMAALKRQFGTWKLALMAYNWGPQSVRNWMAAGADDAAIRGETRRYLDVILGPGWPEPASSPADGDDHVYGVGDSPMAPDPWTRTQLTNGSAVSTPAQWPTSDPRPIRSLVWHDMEGYLPGAISTWNQGAASAHLCVLRDGTIVRTVPIEDIAWHAGTNATTGRTAFWKAHNINPYSIGVELEGFVASGYTREQIDACVRIGRWAQAKYGVKPVRGGDSLDGHHLHSEISNQRSDPGPLFPFDAILDSIKGAPVAAPDQTPAFSYVLGFADLASRLGSGVVGEPVEGEHDAERAGHPIRHQLTTTGELVYWKNENRAEFYRAA